MAVLSPTCQSTFNVLAGDWNDLLGEQPFILLKLRLCVFCSCGKNTQVDRLLHNFVVSQNISLELVIIFPLKMKTHCVIIVLRYRKRSQS